MKKMRLATVMLVVLAVSAGLAGAQITGEPMESRTRNHSTAGGGNVWGCPTTGNSGSPPCVNGSGGKINYRFYSPSSAGGGAINAGVAIDSNPIFIAGNGQYISDLPNSANWFGAGHGVEPIHCAWDAELRGGTGDHAGYYGISAQEITGNGETGNPFRTDCVGTRAVACFSVIPGTGSADPFGTPQGTIAREGGLRGVPVPTVNSSTGPGTTTLGWVDPTNERTIDGAAPPILGANLYLLLDASTTAPLDSRAVSDATLDATATFHSFHPKGGGNSAFIDCAVLPGGTTNYIPAIRVAYANNGDGSPMESLWSANGPTIRCTGSLFTEVVEFEAAYMGKVKGRHVIDVSWQTVAEDGTLAFELLRGESLAGPFLPVVTKAAVGAGEGNFYAVEDRFKAPGNTREVFYTLRVIEADGAADTPAGPIRATIDKLTGKPN
jgi:hypothetical protein